MNLEPIKINNYLEEVQDYYILYPDGKIYSEYSKIF